MIKQYTTYVLLIVLLVLFCFSWQNLNNSRHKIRDFNYISYTTPSQLTGPACLEFKGIVSCFLFLKMFTNIGEKLINKEQFTTLHSDYIYNSTDIITDLDPYFWDAYLFADMSLTWEFGQYEKAIKLLLKAKKHRLNDFQPSYYIGFNYFYFLRDNENGAKYLMDAAKLPGSPNYLPGLASRLSIYSLKHKTAILFIKEMLLKNTNEKIRKQLSDRLKTLIILNQLEDRVDEFGKKYGYFPENIIELVDKKIISDIPIDPYGGEFYIFQKGRVFTTSKMRYSHSEDDK